MRYRARYKAPLNNRDPHLLENAYAKEFDEEYRSPFLRLLPFQLSIYHRCYIGPCANPRFPTPFVIDFAYKFDRVKCAPAPPLLQESRVHFAITVLTAT